MTRNTRSRSRPVFYFTIGRYGNGNPSPQNTGWSDITRGSAGNFNRIRASTWFAEPLVSLFVHPSSRPRDISLGKGVMPTPDVNRKSIPMKLAKLFYRLRSLILRPAFLPGLWIARGCQPAAYAEGLCNSGPTSRCPRVYKGVWRHSAASFWSWREAISPRFRATAHPQPSGDPLRSNARHFSSSTS